MTLSENITSAPMTAFFGSLDINIFLLFFFTHVLTSLLGSKFFGHPIQSLNENLTDAAIKLSKTLLESPIQHIFNLEIGFFLFPRQ